MTGSSRTYKAIRTIAEERVFHQFIAGFNRSHPLSDFVDAGSHKEASDAKIKGKTQLLNPDLSDISIANFELFYRNRHCQHILFAGSADSGYAGFLSQFSSPKKMNEKATLIEGPSFPFDLKRVAKCFRHTTFPTVFRSSKIHVSAGVTPVLTRAKRSGPELISNRERPSPSTVRTGIMTPPTPQASSAPVSTPLSPSLPIYQNKFGQRIDAPLDIDKDYMQHLYQHLRLCNNFYLKGYCPHGKNCEFDHSHTLTPLQLDTFRYKARSSSCRTSFCQDPTCCLGHLCPRGDNCTISQCKFAPEMHSPDTSDLYMFDPASNTRQHMLAPAA